MWEIVGQSRGDLDVLVPELGERDQTPEAAGSSSNWPQPGPADTMVCPTESDDGHAHPVGIQTGGVAVVRQRVQAEIDAVVEFQILSVWLAGNEFDAFAERSTPSLT